MTTHVCEKKDCESYGCFHKRPHKPSIIPNNTAVKNATCANTLCSTHAVYCVEIRKDWD